VMQLKPTFEDFIRTCTPLVRLEDLETQIQERIQKIVSELLGFLPDYNPLETLVKFLQRDKDFLGVLLALTNLSQEKLLRLISAKRFAEQDFGSEWNIDRVHKKVKSDNAFAYTLARLFLEGKDNKHLSEQVADFYLQQLSLPENWVNIINDPKLVANIVRRKLTGEYSDLKGKKIESLVQKKLSLPQSNQIIPFTKGQVELVGGKEVDISIPDLIDPRIMIMISYMETTSSGQTARANEQRGMFQKVEEYNLRHPRTPKRIFINIIDGGGWLARRSDMHKLFESCHYCLNIKQLDNLAAIIMNHWKSK